MPADFTEIRAEAIELLSRVRWAEELAYGSGRSGLKETQRISKRGGSHSDPTGNPSREQSKIRRKLDHVASQLRALNVQMDAAINGEVPAGGTGSGSNFPQRRVEGFDEAEAAQRRREDRGESFGALCRNCRLDRPDSEGGECGACRRYRIRNGRPRPIERALGAWQARGHVSLSELAEAQKAQLRRRGR